MNAIITGSNRGIGLAIVKKFAREGWNIWACVRKESSEFDEQIAQIAAESGVWIKQIAFEINDDAQIKSGLMRIFADKEPIDALVNNAGIGHYELFQRTSVNRAREVFNINFFGPYQITQYVLRKMERQGSGAVVNMSSIASFDANQGDSLYGATKAAINVLTRDLAAEYGKMGVRVNAVAPGPTDTKLLQTNYLTKVGEAVCAGSAMGRLANVEEIANAVFFLASPEASFVNGEILRVDGGRL